MLWNSVCSRRDLGLLRTENKLGGNLWLEILVFVEPDIAGSTLAIEYSEWDLATILGSHIELGYRVYALEDLSSDDGFKGQPGTEKHDFGFETATTKLTFNPRYKATVQLAY